MSPPPFLLPPCGHVPKPYAGLAKDEVRALRQRHLSPSIFHYYGEPLMLVEGRMQYVWDEMGKRYLDAFGGIVTVSVGHCHPRVVAAADAQNQTLQHASTIYLHPNIARYAEALAGKFPPELSVCYFVNSGSEANDLALLMARAFTGRFEVIALRNGYHGGVATALAATSHHTWKYPVPSAGGIQFAQAPDLYRGPYGSDDPLAAVRYASDVGDLIRFATPGRIAAFIAESIQGVGGVVVYPNGYLRAVYEIVREAGGLCIADEVQAGFGRTGDHFWGFQAQGVVPDIVTLAKGIGNGCALAAVVTRPEIAECLAQRLHFNTFGGNPVSCAQGLAVIESIDAENLQANAAARGAQLMSGLRRLQETHEVIGDVRGRGLMVGIEIVSGRSSKAPDFATAQHVLETARRFGLLLGKSGLHGNVIRITPPMCLSAADIDFIIAVIDHALSMER
jgi:alanine-glyoxylate transaminase/(R)-3-amino-2-methylpropionate-pyruvate transaminase